MLCGSPAAWAFSILSPSDAARLRSGQQVSAAVDLGTEIGVARVRYYWYRHGMEPLPAQHATPALISSAASAPPYGGALAVPREALGSMRLLAVGEVVRGRLAGHEEFDEIVVQVEPEAPLVRIEFETEKPMRLDTLRKILDVPAVGVFADGVIRPLQGAGTESIFESSDERVITVTRDGGLQVVGDGTAVITVSNRGQRGTLPVVVKTDGESNSPPVAHGGPDQTVRGGGTVILNGLRSVDPDGDPLRYEWIQVRGNKVSLLDYDAPKATFVAPRVSAKRLFQFRLRVTDMKGPDTMKGADSAPVYVNIWVEP